MNETELLVTSFYESFNIYDPHFLSIEIIVDLLQMKLVYWSYTSAIAELNNDYCMFINDTKNKQQQWQEFGHEMSHFFKDNNCNRKLVKESFVSYCETKADYFAYHFCVPTFMLMNLKNVTVYDVVNLFNVEFNFALRRLDMYKNKFMSRRDYVGSYPGTCQKQKI